MKYSMKFITALVMLIGFSFNVHADHHGEKKEFLLKMNSSLFLVASQNLESLNT